jgi:hypothetical protein
MALLTVYDLRLDFQRIRWLQEATLTTRDCGLEPTHGLFGSPTWWRNIEDGVLVKHHAIGVINNIYSVGASEHPQFTMVGLDGIESNWPRETNRPEDDDFFMIGRSLELEYVLQRARADLSILGIDQTERCILSIRVDVPRQIRYRFDTSRSSAGPGYIRPSRWN